MNPRRGTASETAPPASRGDPVRAGGGRAARADPAGRRERWERAGAPGSPASGRQLRIRRTSEWRVPGQGPDPGGGGRTQGGGARGTHQLQRAEADERAASGAAAHGAGGVPAARDPRPPAPLPPDSGAAPAWCSPVPAQARPPRGSRSPLPSSELAPAFVSFRGAGGGQCCALDPERLAGSGLPRGRSLLGRGRRAGRGAEGGHRW